MTTRQTAANINAAEIVLPALVDPSGLQIRRRILPAPGPGEAIVEIDATGVSFAERAMMRGRYPGQPAFPFVPGYDFVGTVREVGPGVSAELVGTRTAAITKLGGWATHIVCTANDLVPVPIGLDPALVETVLVNGVTALQMLHRDAKVKSGQTIVVHGANGGVGSVLCQLAIHAGIRVIGTAAPRDHEALRAMGVEPVDYDVKTLVQRIRAWAPAGVDAVFDRLGLASVRMSYGLLASRGSIVAYGNALLLDGGGCMVRAFIALLLQLALWNMKPGGRKASFYNIWAGSRMAPRSFRSRQRSDLTELFQLLSAGAITPPIAARFGLADVRSAVTFAESRNVQGKVVLTPSTLTNSFAQRAAVTALP